MRLTLLAVIVILDRFAIEYYVSRDGIFGVHGGPDCCRLTRCQSYVNRFDRAHRWPGPKTNFQAVRLEPTLLLMEVLNHDEDRVKR